MRNRLQNESIQTSPKIANSILNSTNLQNTQKILLQKKPEYRSLNYYIKKKFKTFIINLVT
nr:MAG TPA: hypothetical protein [Caudoviricetes sp.]